jgi:hypothetical protein
VVHLKFYEYKIGIPFQDEPLPKDKRRYPWPTIRKQKWVCNTWSEFIQEYIKSARISLENEFNESFKINKKDWKFTYGTSSRT